ncbi:MAG: hypothetical protein NT169_24395 [Chloroflexi bacterium]|nr:hypothetical protein [Chloroflexota bacterium]
MPSPLRRLSADRRLIPAGLAGLLLFATAQIVVAWRAFVMFMADQGWYLQVALRMSRGEVLYRDVAWAYGPLSAQALAALFRGFGPDAACASAVNAALLLLAIPLTYTAVRSLVSSRAALLLTAYAALIGAYVGGDLIRWHLHIYTQASVWGFGASLAALVTALRWASTRRTAWLVAAGLAAAAAVLSKPEYGLAAAGSVVAVLSAGRAGVRAWGWWLAAWLLPAAAGAAWQASVSGWGPLWRGYIGYDQVAARRAWGLTFPQRELRLLLSSYSAWAAGWLWWRSRRAGRGAVAPAGENRPRIGADGHGFFSLFAFIRVHPRLIDRTGWLWWRSRRAGRGAVAPAGENRPRIGADGHGFFSLSAFIRAHPRLIDQTGWLGWPLLLILLAVGSVAPDFIGGPRAVLNVLRTGDWGQLAFSPVYVLTWLATLPWGPLLPLLLWAGWIARRRGAAPAWWGLWAFAVLTDLRYVTTGYAFGGAVAPALAVLAWLVQAPPWWPPNLGGNPSPPTVEGTEGPHSPPRPTLGESGRPLRLAVAVLGIATIANLVTQVTARELYLNAPRTWLQTAVGPVAVLASASDEVTAIQALLRETVPPGQPIFTTGWGAGWYLLVDRPNPTAFDIVFSGIGDTGPEAAAVTAGLIRHPPAAVVSQLRPSASQKLSAQGNFGRWWASESVNYEDRTPPDASYWTVWTRR